MATFSAFLTQGRSALVKSLPGLKKVSLLFLLLALSSLSFAQSRFVPGIEVFGGYSHLSFPSGFLGFGDRTEMNGWQGAVTIPHIVKGLGITGEVSGDYAKSLEQFTYAAGPQYKWEVGPFDIIGHILYGAAQTRIRSAGSTFTEASDRHRALVFGGEVDYPFSSRFSVRIVQADAVVTNAFGNTQDNIRLSTGLIFRFGKH
ncbi:MAG TPA: hypothetical protein VJ731_09520 [Terriglobales bacterium]|nr:hypothetical protein [Terriglobales bacterium]